MAKCGPINRLIMHRAKGLSGSMGQNVGGGNCVAVPGYAWAPGGANYGATLISARVENSTPNQINLTFNGPLTATTAACGWTYSVNGGVDTAPSLASITDAKMELTMAAPVVCGDVVTVSYDATGCDLAVDGEAFESVTDSSVTNGVNTPVPVITVQPTNQAVTAPAAATFSVTATGATGYQWQLNGADIPGATSNSYTTDATVDGQTGDYRCRVSNDCGSVLSDVATLTVTAPVPVFDGTIANMVSTVGTPMTPYDASTHFTTGGDVAEYALTGAPAWMSISAAGVITGTPDAVANTTGITVKGTNSGGSDSSNAWAMDAQAALQAPIFDGTIANMTSTVGTPMTPYDASVHFGTGGAVATYSLQNNPAWMSINASTGEITGTPDAEAVTAGITVTGTNAAGSDASNAWQMDAQASVATVLVEDTFTDVNGTLVINHTPDTDSIGNGWQLYQFNGLTAGSPPIQNNEVNWYSAPTQYWTCAIDAGEADVQIECQVKVGVTAGNNPVVSARHSWAANETSQIEIQVTTTNGNFRIVERDAGVATERASIAKSYAAETYYDVVATLNGTSIVATIDGASEISYGSLAVNNTRGFHGFTNATGNPPLAFDNFKVTGL